VDRPDRGPEGVVPHPAALQAAGPAVHQGLIEAGKYRAVVHRSYPLEQVREATRYVETERKTGNVVLTIPPL